MIKDFVRDNHARLTCTECGAETVILKYSFDHRYGFHRINTEATKNNIDVFYAKHALCKNTGKQTDLFQTAADLLLSLGDTTAAMCFGLK